MTRETLLPLLGYDARLTARLSAAQRTQLRSVAVGWLAAAFLVAWPLGYVMWLTERSWTLATLAPLAVFLLCLNLLRVAVAGGGASAHFTPVEVENWRPGWTPSVFLLVLGALMAQPAHLLVAYASHGTAIDAYRTLLSARHETVAQSIPSSVSQFGAALDQCEFVVFRLQLLWQEPTNSARFTGLYVACILVPVYWSRYVALGALRAYERLRYEQTRTFFESTHLDFAARRHSALSRWVSYAQAHAAPQEESLRAAATPSQVRQSLAEPRRARRAQLILKWRNQP